MTSSVDRIVAEVLAMRASHPQRPALDVLDRVMRRHRAAPSELVRRATRDDDPLLPPSAFARVLRDAFDPTMPEALFASRGGADPDAFWPRWERCVIEPFGHRYGLWAMPGSGARRHRLLHPPHR